MYREGSLVSTYNGPAKAGAWIVVEEEGQSPEGRYVVLQKNNEELDEDNWQLHVADLAAFGRYTDQLLTECEGWRQPEVIFSESYDANYGIKGIFTDGGKYWLTPNRYIGRGFTIQLSNCSVSIAGVLIRNVNHGLVRATRAFRISGSLNQSGTWKKLLQKEIESPLTPGAPAPTIETFYFNETMEMKYLRFDFDNYWGGLGGGLDFFAVITESGYILVLFF